MAASGCGGRLEPPYVGCYEEGWIGGHRPPLQFVDGAPGGRALPGSVNGSGASRTGRKPRSTKVERTAQRAVPTMKGVAKLEPPYVGCYEERWIGYFNRAGSLSQSW